MALQLRTLGAALLAVIMLAGAALAQKTEEEAPANLRSGAQTTINGQMQAFRAREHDQAFSYADPSLQKLFRNTETFIGMVKGGYGAIYDAQGWSFGRSRMDGATLYQELYVTGPNGREWIALYTMKQDAAGNWRIGGVRIIPGAGQTT